MSSILGLVSSHKQNEADLMSLLSSSISQIAIPTQLVFSTSERNDSTESFEMYLEGFEISCYVLQILVKCYYETRNRTLTNSVPMIVKTTTSLVPSFVDNL